MDNRNTILAIVLSLIVLVGWQYFYALPQMEKQQQLQQQQASTPAQPAPGPGAPTAQQGQQPGPQPTAPAGSPLAPVADRAAALQSAPRVAIDTPRVKGSISLRGGRLDDLSLREYRETVSPTSPNIVLLEPPGAPAPFYVEQGFVNATGGTLALPDANALWTAETSGPLTASSPVTLRYDNGAGLVFRRTIAVDDQYMFTITDQVTNNTAAPVSLHPYALVSRHGTPATAGYYILHEGLIGVIGEEGLKETGYSTILEEKQQTFKGTGGWLGITDKYWAASVVPPQTEPMTARFAAVPGPKPIYQTDYLLDARTVAPGATVDVAARIFAGAKVVSVIQGYQEQYGIKQFDLMIDWGWFYFITKPLFYLLDFFFHLVGNFGVSILVVTVLVKLVFFPLANKSYVSMSKMKLLQPELLRIRDRYKDDRVKQQQAMMELYKKEKINPISGCLPILIQIPVFFALYKVLFVTIEMRHAPFFGWIQDLSAPDPTSIFNLFGLLPFAVPAFLLIGIWPLIMGFTMFLQMRLNPPPPDPVQAMLFNWMPVLFTFMLASFPAGLVIYWSWNNFLSIVQQYVIMRRQGVEIDMWGNVKSAFKKPKPNPNPQG